jgi:hypothetical protein
MPVNSWLRLPEEDPRHRLPDDLRQQDSMAARDCGWVDQMRPFVASHATAGEWIIDPFCGFGSTLLAALDGGVPAAGVELDPQRVDLTRQRLARFAADAEHYPVLNGSLAQTDVRDALRHLPSGERRRFSLCLTNIPYFGCNTGETPSPEADSGRLYGERYYESYLQGLREVFVGVHALLEANGWCVVMAQNLQLAGHFVPLAWDVARLLGERFVLHEERVLIYDRPADPAPAPATTRTNRAHEYALICRKKSFGLDVVQGRELLARLQEAGFNFVVYGSFLQYLQGEPGVVPNDIDLLYPPDDAEVSRLIRWLEGAGFRIESWNAPIHPPVSVQALAYRYYFRARRVDRQGRTLQLDISIAESRDAFETQRRQHPDAIHPRDD